MKKIFIVEFYAFDEDLRVYDNSLDAYNAMIAYLDNLYDLYTEKEIEAYKEELLDSYAGDYIYEASLSFGVKGLFSICEYELRETFD